MLLKKKTTVLRGTRFGMYLYKSDKGLCSFGNGPPPRSRLRVYTVGDPTMKSQCIMAKLIMMIGKVLVDVSYI